MIKHKVVNKTHTRNPTYSQKKNSLVSYQSKENIENKYTYGKKMKTPERSGNNFASDILTHSKEYTINWLQQMLSTF